MWMQSPAWQSIFAPPRHWSRKKVTVMREVSCDARVIARVTKPSKDLKQPRWEDLGLENVNEIVDLEEKHFSPTVYLSGIYLRLQLDGALIELTPFEQNKAKGSLLKK